MSNVKSLGQLLEKMVKLQKSLYQLALNKTDILKIGDAEALGQLMKNELSHIKAIEALNNNSESIKNLIASEQGVPLPVTLSAIIESVPASEKDELRSAQTELLLVTEELKKRNELNQELLQQSLQFVNLNLDLLVGQQDPGNYSPFNGDEIGMSNRPIFNSRA
ncbi:flagellar protein FlgN [Bacillus salacetis]|uniref:flagellar protein FlgN n=1 Tax=Bacillus salacetis TaxID=2315464 RepID=UPI003BA33181